MPINQRYTTMKIKLIHYLLFSLSPFLLFSLSPLLLLSQSPKPENWDSIIARPWYYGNVFNKPAFIYVDETNPATAYFFAATTAIPEVYQVDVKWKNGAPSSLAFKKENQKIKARFIGSFTRDTISGILITNRKNAIRLGIIPELSLFLVKEIPNSKFQIPTSPHPHASMPPSPHAPAPPRYLSQVFPMINTDSDISYGAATGYYTSMPVETEGYDYQQIILDAMERMYVNPTKEAVLHILNRDPVSFGVTDIQPLRMDIYQPLKDTLTRRPLILLLHGGAFLLGDKATETTKVLATDFAKKGYVVASVNYRMGFNPASKSSLERSAYRAVQDARAALRYLSANAGKYRIDPDYVFLGGSSAGAITALNTAFMEEHERPESTGRNLWRAQMDLGGLDESTNSLTGSFKIRAVVNLWGAVNDTAIIDNYENIPVLSIHGDADRIVPYSYAYPFLDLDTTITSNIVSKLYGSFPIHQRLRSLGIHSELLTLPGAGHEPQYEPGKKESLTDTILARATDFYFRSLFHFPEIAGPRQIAIGMSPPTYSLPLTNDIDYYWLAEGGKVIPGDTENSVRVVWLTEKGEGKVRLWMVHKNMASVEAVVEVGLP
jgi:acetyl esterase/lipase